MNVDKGTEPADAEARFRAIFAHLAAITAYARRRGGHDPDAIAAEAMTIAWRRLADVPRDDPRPWLFATVRNLLLAEWRQGCALSEADPVSIDQIGLAFEPAPEARGLDPELFAALRSLSTADREALLLVAWEDLLPSLAARSAAPSTTSSTARVSRSSAPA